MDVLERDAQLATLHERLAAARSGTGQLVWIQGEAGIGKSTLVAWFCAQLRGARVVQGSCDPLDTPRPLGPAVDIVERLGGVDVPAPERLSRQMLFRRFHDELTSPAWVTVAVIEDAHWADEATLDLLRYVGRRLDQLRALLLVTFRDDELDADHALRSVLGDLATAPGTSRIELPPLTRAAVAELAAAADEQVDADRLFQRSAGNPFFVSEVLASGGALLPASVRDAVLARAGRLPPPARATLEAAAVAPTRIETWLLEELVGDGRARVDDCVAAGLLRPDAPGTVAFRHELARLAVLEVLPPSRCAALHDRAVTSLLRRYGDDVDSARVAYHAEQAGDTSVAREQAERAARRATELGAYREAAAQYDRALRHAPALAPSRQADLLENYARAARAIDRIDVAMDAADRAVALRRLEGDARRLGSALVLRASSRWAAGDSAGAVDGIQEAIAILETLGSGHELTAAYAGAASFAMLARDHPAALHWGQRALELAERLDAEHTQAWALNSIGSSKLVNSEPGGATDLQRSIDIARTAGYDDLVSHGLLNLGSATGEVRDYAIAEPTLRETITFASRHDLDGHQHYATAWLARVRFERGDWVEADALIDALHLDDHRISPITVIVALGVRGRLSARRGGTDPTPDLERAWDLAQDTGDLQRLWPIAAARAEAAWLRGETHTIPPLVEDVYTLAHDHGHAWAVGELALWHQRVGVEVEPEVAVAEPFALHVAGRLGEAAAAWEALGCPFEVADALADSDQAADLRRALAIVDELGARTAAARIRRRLRQLGEHDIPRGPRPATAANPAGLTPRQTEVLALVAEGLSDADIATRLHLSPKTVGHHVSAILDKLGASSRTEAAHRAHQLDLPS